MQMSKIIQEITTKGIHFIWKSRRCCCHGRTKLGRGKMVCQSDTSITKQTTG